MSSAPEVLANRQRLDAVRRLMTLHGVPNPVLDRLTRLAAQLLEAPISLLTLVHKDRQFILSAHGLPAAVAANRQLGIEYSICQHAVASGRPLIVPDARGHALLTDNAAVIELGVTSYAGMPLVTGDGLTVGALCVIDLLARDWTDDQLLALSHLAEIAIGEMLAQTLPSGAVADDEWQAVASRWWRV